MWLELIAIGVLILLNGFFACAELAIVNTRRSRIKQLVEEKNVQARLVQAFQEDSERFLATTQIGITVAGASAAAMGGVVAIDHLKPVFEAIPLAFVQAWAEPIAVGIVVLIISYFSLVLGERSEEHTSELQSRLHLVCRLLLEKKKTHPRSHG